MAVKLSKSVLDRALKESPKDRFLYDSGIPGFAFRIRGGRGSFVFEYRRHGRVRRITIGRYGPMTVDDARVEAAKHYRATRAGGDPVEDRRSDRQRRTTFAEVAELYLEDLQSRAELGAKRGKRSSAAEFRRMMDRLILPRLGRVAIADVELEHVENLHRSLHETPAQANRALTVVSAVLGFAEKRKLRSLGANPCRAVVRYPENGKRDRLSDDELVRLGQALREAEEKASTTVRSAVLGIRLLALTGMRRSEVFGAPTKARAAAVNGLAWGDVHLEPEKQLIRLRDAKAGARDVPLGRAAIELLSTHRPAGVDPQTAVCATARGGALVGVDRIRRRIFQAAGITGKDLHSLRHTFASKALDVGVPELLVKALLGHVVSAGETARYLHPGRGPLYDAADLVSGTVAALMSDSSGRMLEFRHRTEFSEKF
jgi:integrase